MEEAQKAIEYPNVQTVQIVYNAFRHRPKELSHDSQFEADDHRRFNRHGDRFDVEETFSGVDYDVALAAVEESCVSSGRFA